MTNIVVVGAGVAGLSAALQLAHRGYTVQLIEKETLGSGSSGRNPGRMGHGFHYVDIETAKMYLRASIQVQRTYPNYLIGQEHSFNHPIRHGRYFITKDSDNSKDEILKTYEALRAEYARLISEDPDNEVFGSPEDFFRILDPSEYEGLVNMDRVELGVETAEHLFNWSLFASDIKKTILDNKNITLYENMEVKQIVRGELGESRFSIHAIEKNGELLKNHIFHTDYLINSTWENIEKLNEQVGFPMIQGSRTNRLKGLLIVKLPDSLLQANSMFFCMGQHCMFSNLGNGYGMMTFANITNMETSTGVDLSERAHRFLKGEISISEKNEIAQNMLSGVSQYIPDMINATIIDLKFGIVQTMGSLSLEDLKNPNSNFHKRDYDGLREEQVGFVSNPCMKFFYFVRNGINVADIVDSEVIASSIINQCIVDIEEYANAHDICLNIDLRKTIKGNLERHITSTSLKSEHREVISFGISHTLFNKKLFVNELNETTIQLRTIKF